MTTPRRESRGGFLWSVVGGGVLDAPPFTGKFYVRRAGRRGERSERRQWRMKRGERVAAVKISSARREAARKFWVPQQDHTTRPCPFIVRAVGDAGPYGSGIRWCGAFIAAGHIGPALRGFCDIFVGRGDLRPPRITRWFLVVGCRGRRPRRPTGLSENYTFVVRAVGGSDPSAASGG